jgi:molybdopterin-binding protein
MAYIYIDPKDIIISCKQFSSSALNSFYGKVTKISEQNKLIRLTIDIGVQLISIITKESFQDMKINIGNNVCLTFKASSVKCY